MQRVDFDAQLLDRFAVYRHPPSQDNLLAARAARPPPPPPGIFGAEQAWRNGNPEAEKRKGRKRRMRGGWTAAHYSPNSAPD